MKANDADSSSANPTVDDSIENSVKHGLCIDENQGCKTRSDVPINVIARVRPLISNEYRHPVCIEVVDS